MAIAGAVQAAAPQELDTQHVPAVSPGSQGNLHQQHGADPCTCLAGATDPTGLYAATTASAKKAAANMKRYFCNCLVRSSVQPAHLWLLGQGFKVSPRYGARGQAQLPLQHDPIPWTSWQPLATGRGISKPGGTEAMLCTQQHGRSGGLPRSRWLPG